MRTANVIRGRIEEHAKALGTVTPEMVEERAREIAITNGRLSHQFTLTDLDQARHELKAAHHAPPEAVGEPEEELAGPEDILPISPGQEAPTRVPTDEQTLSEVLVREGTDEATHEQMIAGNRESRRRDRNYDDQLPST